MTETERLLAEILAFCAERKMSPATFGRKSVDAGHLVERLQGGKSITIVTMERVRAYIAAERAKLAPHKAATAEAAERERGIDIPPLPGAAAE